jgi:hypothetical protein
MPSRPHLTAAALVLASFWILLQASDWSKSATYDETVHAAAGRAYWSWNDYRLNPENGNLPQRVAGLALAAGGVRPPPRDSAAWQTAQEWVVADLWMHRPGEDVPRLLRWGRAGCGLLAVALAALVAGLSWRRFGPAAALVSLIACVLNPAILANGALMTSDTAAALFFLAAATAIWAALRRPTPAGIALAGLAVGALLVSKMSAFLIAPIALVLGLARIAREPRARAARAGIVAASALAAGAIAIAVVWGFYDFRYSAFADTSPPAQFDPGWAQVLGAAPASGLPRLLTAIRHHHLLPEAFIYGCAYAWKFSHWRDAFLNGVHHLRGWPGFFPYAFLVKTPLPLFALLTLAAAATLARWRDRRRREGIGLGRQAGEAAYATLPLWVLMGVDGAAAVASHLDIGHRHILPLYPPLFILAGAAAIWPPGGGARARIWPRAALALILGALAAETAGRFPDYLAYFNGIVRPAEAYRHLVDSSLDWGQDLPAVKKEIDAHPEGKPYTLAYFGSDRPESYGIDALVAHGASPAEAPAGSLAVMTRDFAPGERARGTAAWLGAHPEYEVAATARVNGQDLDRVILIKRAPALRLEPGTYLVSATVLQQMEYNLAAPWGPWNPRFEDEYQRLRRETAPLLSEHPADRQAALAAGTAADWWRLLNDLLRFDALRFSRLTAYLRRRTPDGNIHGSILIFRLSAEELSRALNGPPPEWGPDLPAQLAESGLAPE